MAGLIISTINSSEAGARTTAGKLGFVRLVQGNREGDSGRNKRQIGLSIAANIAQCKNKLDHLAMALKIRLQS
jgi:hypothetical protein